MGDPLKGLLIVGDKLIKQRREFWKGGRLSGNMRRVGEKLFAVPDKLAKTAEPQLLTQTHYGGSGYERRLRQLTNRNLAHQQRVLRKVGEDAVLRAGQRCPAR